MAPRPAEDDAHSGDGLAGHERESIEAIASFHRDHYLGASRLQRLIDAFTNRLGRPVVVALLLAIFGVWIFSAYRLTGGHVEQPGFTWIELGATLLALFIALLILATQRRQDQLAERREQLTLELAVLADRKVAKVIALVEELRRDVPDVADRQDPESDAMARPTDPGAVMAALDAKAAGPSRE